MTVSVLIRQDGAAPSIPAAWRAPPTTSRLRSLRGFWVASPSTPACLQPDICSPDARESAFCAWPSPLPRATPWGALFPKWAFGQVDLPQGQLVPAQLIYYIIEEDGGT